MKKDEQQIEHITEINECESIAEGSYFWNELRTIVEDGAANSDKED
ncbi:hypothetical protein [Bacillus suaedaesalsae]|uniref:Uncharacterized protein n=1 Tax=Bacillus suaedaesalsae TaxID=2810349 RepID=A0ABS2DJJ9_9BACI|nr:hypothetical protein [Bacillus suaedaesalsae]MBM6618670.1 hypothetical protein [Bacillus suaedaesalsae]